ncbi:MAG TPA: polyprenyl diphosphate synthase [Gammaproteobacteria bacterium]|nr:polyprenyl diphosphate synthase [Gammaproteobacteria bacterium]
MSKLRHVAIIMDGNGRWAHARNMPRSFGHAKGVSSVKAVLEACQESSVQELTLFALSSENMHRPSKELQFLFKLFSEKILSHLDRLVHQGVRIRVLGDINSLPETIIENVKKAEEKTKKNKGLLLNICFNYGGRWHIINVAKQLSQQGPIDEKAFDQAMFQDLSEPDLLIRTGGDYRISNFLLYHLAYSELYFTPVLWPDFNQEEFKKALGDFASRKRRFGLLKNESIKNTESKGV